MKENNICRILNICLICLVCIFLANTSTQAKKNKQRIFLWDVEEDEETKGRTMRDFMKRRGLFYGESGNCMYTYINHKKEVKIIGLKLKAKKVKIPAKIRGKKVTVIELFNPGEEGDSHPQVEYIQIPQYVREISMVFKHEIFSYQVLPKLKEYDVSPKNKHFKSKDGILFSKNGKKLLNVPRKRKSENYQIPYGVKSISDHCLADCYRIQAVTMPDTVTKVGDQSFIASGIEKIRLSRNLKFMGESALYRTKLREVVFPGSLVEIPEGCLGYCKNLKKVTIRPGVKRIGRIAFVECKKLKKLIIPPSVKKIAESSLEYDYSNSPFLDLKQLTIYAKKKSYAYKITKKWKRQYKYKYKIKKY